MLTPPSVSVKSKWVQNLRNIQPFLDRPYSLSTKSLKFMKCKQKKSQKQDIIIIHIPSRTKHLRKKRCIDSGGASWPSFHLEYRILPSGTNRAFYESESTSSLSSLKIWSDFKSLKRYKRDLIFCFQPIRDVTQSLHLLLIHSITIFESPSTWRCAISSLVAKIKVAQAPKSSTLVFEPKT